MMIHRHLKAALAALGVFQLSSSSRAVQAAAAVSDDVEVSYLVEPFEYLDLEDAESGWFLSQKGLTDNVWNFSMRTAAPNEGEDALFVNAALRVDYTTYELQDSVITVIQSDGSSAELGWKQLPTFPSHNCHGATKLSLWYKFLPNSEPI